MTTDPATYRKRVLDELIPHARRDERIVLLIGDMGFGAVDGFRARFPDRVHNLGIMEQAQVGVAAGLAMAGFRPVVYNTTNFLAFRALEQVRVDLVKQGLDVKLIGTGAKDYFSFLGYSHCCGDDDVAIMRAVGMAVFDPYADADVDLTGMVADWIAAPTPAYLRV